MATYKQSARLVRLPHLLNRKCVYGNVNGMQGTSCCVIKLLRAFPNTLTDAQIAEIAFIQEMHSALSVINQHSSD